MDNMESKILEVLNDPEKMSEIMNLAKGLGFSPTDESAPSHQEEDTNPLIGTVLGLLQQSSASNEKQDALWKAIMPYLDPERQKKLQKALKFGKLSQMAMIAFKNYQDNW